MSDSAYNEFIKKLQGAFTSDEFDFGEGTLNSDKLLKIIAGSISEYVAITSFSGEYKYVSDSYKSLGYDLKSLIKSNFFDQIHPDDRSYVDNQFKRALLSHHSKTIQFRYKKNNGSYVWFESNALFIRDESDMPLAIIFISKDISKLISKIEKLEQNELQLRKIIDFSTNVFYEHDTRFVLNFISQQVEGLLGYSQSEASRNWSDYLTPNPVNDKGVEIKKRALQTGEMQEPYEMELKHKNGKNVWVKVQESPVIHKGVVVALSGSLTDITEQKEIEKELRELNATKDQLFSIIAHDLRNPINNIKGFADLIKMNFEKYTDSKKLYFLNFISESSLQLTNLIENLLVWARSNRDAIHFEPQNIVLYNIIEEVVAELDSVAKRKNLFVQNLVDKNQTVFVDFNMIKIVIHNILSNAIKYSHTDGTIYFNATLLNDNYILNIIDNGVGISSDDIHRILHSDQISSTEGTTGEQGTGLGLMVVKEFIKRNNGKLSLKSEIDAGTTFTIELPVSK